MTASKTSPHLNTLPASHLPVEYYENDIFIGPNTISPPLNPPMTSPPPSTRTNTELNLSVLKRYHPATTSILLIAPYAALYTFLPSTQQWEKSAIQGTLFVVGLAPPPSGLDRYAIIILNRLGLENFILELQPGADVDLEEEIVVVRAGAEEDGTIWGLWIFEEEEGKSTAGKRGEVERVLRSCVDMGLDEGEEDEDRSLLSNDVAHTNGAINGRHVSPLDSPPQQAHQYPIATTSPDPSVPLSQSENPNPQPSPDILGALFHKAMLNYRGSS